MRKLPIKFFVLLNVITLAVAVFTLVYVVTDNQKSLVINSASKHEHTDQHVSLPSDTHKTNDSIPTFAPIIKNAKPTVVNISTKGKVTVNQSPFFNSPFFNDPFFDNFFKRRSPRLPLERETQSIGSGVIVDSKNGYILTNHHVIDNADQIFVTLYDKTRLEASLVGSDPETDIAVIKVESDQLDSIMLGHSSSLEVGDFVVAIGNPFGLGHTVTSGIVSALERSGVGLVDGYENFIQTDASINPGNSGGALINLKGELIGINTAIMSRNGGNVGIGFAIPVDMAQGIMKQIVEHGEVKRGQLGVHIQDVTHDISEALNLKDAKGALVASVVEQSGAYKAGIKTGDVIIKLNGVMIKNAADLRNRVGGMRVDEEVKVTLLRDEEEKIVNVQIGKRTTSSNGDGVATEEVKLLEGASFRPSKNGVEVASVEQESPALRAGLRKGDVIISANRINVQTPEELFDAAKKKKKGILLNLKRGNTSMFIVIN